MKDYIVVPLGEIINKEYNTSKIEDSFKKFSCHREEDLENFLVNKAITYEKSDIGKTYLCLDAAELKEKRFVIMAYFTIAQRAVDISALSSKKEEKCWEAFRVEIP